MARSVVVLPAPLAPRSVVMPPCLETETQAVKRLGRAVKGAEILDFEQSRHQFACPR